eukprot:gene29575-36854_t
MATIRSCELWRAMVDVSLFVPPTQHGLKMLHINMPEEAVRDMLAYDDDGNGIDFEEFADMMEGEVGAAAWWNVLLRKRELKEIFSYIDQDGSGAIDIDELLTVLEQVSANSKTVMSKIEVTKLFEEADADGSGEIEFSEFCAVMDTCLDLEPQFEMKNGVMNQKLFTGCWCGDEVLKCPVDAGPSLQNAFTAVVQEDADLIVLDKSDYTKISKFGFEGVIESNTKELVRLPVFSGV